MCCQGFSNRREHALLMVVQAAYFLPLYRWKSAALLLSDLCWEREAPSSVCPVHGILAAGFQLSWWGAVSLPVYLLNFCRLLESHSVCEAWRLVLPTESDSCVAFLRESAMILKEENRLSDVAPRAPTSTGTWELFQRGNIVFVHLYFANHKWGCIRKLSYPQRFFLNRLHLPMQDKWSR